PGPPSPQDSAPRSCAGCAAPEPHSGPGAPAGTDPAGAARRAGPRGAGPAGDAAAPGSPARSLDGDLSHRAPAVAVDLVGDDLRRRGEVLRDLLLHRLEVRGVHGRARALV